MSRPNQRSLKQYGSSCTLAVATDGRIHEVLGGGPALLGAKTHEEVCGRSLLEFAAEEHRLLLREFLSRSGYSTDSIALEIVIGDGDRKCVRMQAMQALSTIPAVVRAGLIPVKLSVTCSKPMSDRVALLNQRFFDIAQQPAVILGSDGHTLDVNRAFVRTWRFPSRCSVRGGRFADYWDCPTRLAEALSIAERDGAWEGSLCAVRSDSTLFDVSVVLNRVDDEQAQSHRFIASLEPRQKESVTPAPSRLIDSNAINYFEFSPDAVFLINREGVIRMANRSAGLMHDRLPEDMVGKNIREFDDAISQTQVEKRISKCLSGERMRFEVNHINPDGGIIPLEVIAIPFEYEGEPHVLAIDRDISERVSTQNLLRENEERLRLALSSTKQGTYDLNVQTGQCIVSDEYARMLGYDPETFVETNANWLARLHPDDRIGCETNYRDYVEGKLDEYRVEFRQRTQEGGWKWILSVGQIIAYDVQGNPLRMIGTHTDITRMKRVQEELDQQRVQLARLGRVSISNSLAAAVAHELNQPMCAIANYSASLIRSIDDTLPDLEMLKHDLEEINETVHRAASIIKRFKRLMSSKTLKTESVGMSELIEASLDLIGNELRLGGGQVKTDFEPGVPDVHADKTLIQQVICNLTMNAYEAMLEQPIDQRSITISVSYCEEENSIECRFCDTGPGIAEARRADLFDACVSGKPEGLGLGLTISKMIVAAHHGDLRLISTDNEGSIFSFTIPIRRQESSTASPDALFVRRAPLESFN